MTLNIEALTTAALSAAMEGAMRRQAVIAGNIANANAPGYAALRVSFDAQVAEARTALRERGLLDASAIDSLRGQVETVPGPGGAGAQVQVDVEMAELTRNAVQFQALAQGLSRHLAIQAMAVADGRK